MEKNNEPIQEKDVIRDKNGDEIEVFNADHPARQKAIEILESVSAYMGDEDMFDCVDNIKSKHNTRWYDLEDMITDIIINY